MTAKQQIALDWAQARLQEGCGYIMGASGQICSEAFRKQQAKQYATYDGNPNYGRDVIMGTGAKWDKRKVYDCQGFMKGVYKAIGLALLSGATTQYNNAKKTYAKVGPISEMPSGGIAGAQLWRQSKSNASVMSHTSVCIGNGKCIEAQGTKAGVVESSNISTYTYYGVPEGLLDDEPVYVDSNDKITPSYPAIGNEYTVGVTAKGGVNMREIPGGGYMLKIPEYVDVEITEYIEVGGKKFGRTTYAAPSGKYKGDLYTGWVDMRYVDISAEGEALQPLDTNNPDCAVWVFLKQHNLSDNVAAGIMGNIYAESAFISNNLQNTGNKTLSMTDVEYTDSVDANTYTEFVHDGYGYGLCQWTHWSRKQELLQYAKSQLCSIGDINMQLRFMWQELQSYSAVVSVLNNADSTLREASDAFMVHYEKPANTTDANKAARAAHGQRYYDKFVGRV